MSDKINKNLSFWKSVGIGGKNDCWPWCSDVDIMSGFPVYSRRMVLGSEAVSYAHRIAYILSFGPVPLDHIVRHTCRNRVCCNPSHLIAMRTHPDEDGEYIVTHHYYDSERSPTLSEFEKRRIKSLREDGLTIRQIAFSFKVSRSTISRILKDA